MFQTTVDPFEKMYTESGIQLRNIISTLRSSLNRLEDTLADDTSENDMLTAYLNLTRVNASLIVREIEVFERCFGIAQNMVK